VLPDAYYRGCFVYLSNEKLYRSSCLKYAAQSYSSNSDTVLVCGSYVKVKRDVN